MVPCVPIMIIPYTKAANMVHQCRNKIKKRIKNGARNMTLNQLKKGSQFFLVSKMFSLEKNSDKICFTVGLTKVPFSSFHP